MRWRGARYLTVVVAAVAAGLPVLAIAATESIAELQARFDRENDSIRKVKLLLKLGDAQMEQTRRASQSNDFSTMDSVMEKYRDNARTAVEALKKQHPDAERHTGGYKQLQMQVDKSIRELDEMLIVAPAEYRPPLDLVRHDLAAIDDELLKLLFPAPRSEHKKADNKTGAHPPPVSRFALENYT